MIFFKSEKTPNRKSPRQPLLDQGAHCGPNPIPDLSLTADAEDLQWRAATTSGRFPPAPALIERTSSTRTSIGAAPATRRASRIRSATAARFTEACGDT